MVNLINQNKAPIDSVCRCIHCGEEIPAIEVEVKELGIKRMVQPACECEVKEQKRLQEEAEKFQIQKDINKMFAFSDLGERYKNATLENFEARKGSDACKMLTEVFISEFEEWKEQSLSYWGNVGNGKTHLAAAVANALKNKGYIVIFIKMTELLDLIKSTFGKDQKGNRVTEYSKEDIIKALMQCDMLILDDIGAEKITDWVEDEVFKIIDGRYVRKKKIMVTSNLELEELEQHIKSRSFDRLNHMSQFLENKATSKREEEALKRQEALMKKHFNK